MKPKEYRDRLFRSGRPNIRPLEILNDDGYGKDMGVLWAAYKTGTFDLPEMDQEEFAEFMVESLSGFNIGWIIEDNNAKFKDKKGPVGFVAAAVNEWELEPHFEAFSWATPSNKLKSVVAFLQMLRYDKNVGIVNVYALDNDVKFYKRLKNYGVLHYAGKIPHGDRRGDRHIFFVRGKKRA